MKTAHNFSNKIDLTNAVRRYWLLVEGDDIHPFFTVNFIPGDGVRPDRVTVVPMVSVLTKFPEYDNRTMEYENPTQKWDSNEIYLIDPNTDAPSIDKSKIVEIEKTPHGWFNMEFGWFYPTIRPFRWHDFNAISI